VSIRVLLVDDHPVVREGLRRMLEVDDDIEVVGEAASGKEALARIAITSPSIVLLDMRMPGMEGIETIRRIKERCPGTNIIVLTLYGDQYLSQAIEAGAVGYLVKDVGSEELIRSIRAVDKGQSILHSSLSRGFFNEFASLARGKTGYKSHLSPRKLEIIRLIAAGKTNKEIGAQLFLSETTVKREVSEIPKVTTTPLYRKVYSLYPILSIISGFSFLTSISLMLAQGTNLSVTPPSWSYASSNTKFRLGLRLLTLNELPSTRVNVTTGDGMYISLAKFLTSRCHIAELKN